MSEQTWRWEHDLLTRQDKSRSVKAETPMKIQMCNTFGERLLSRSDVNF
jgi:hypothetical protein